MGAVEYRNRNSLLFIDFAVRHNLRRKK